MGTLYVVATPIGNLEDITLRALRVLGEVAVVAAEDTRTTRNLLTRHGIAARLTALTEHNTARAVPRLLATLASADVAVVSEAGTPAISDPGYELVRAATYRLPPDRVARAKVHGAALPPDDGDDAPPRPTVPRPRSS